MYHVIASFANIGCLIEIFLALRNTHHEITFIHTHKCTSPISGLLAWRKGVHLAISLSIHQE